jgi:hypothetical protein
VVIEKRLRDRLGVEPGYLAVQRIVGDRVEIRFHPPEHDRSLRGVLAGSSRRSVSTDEWSDMKERAWAEASGSDEERVS